ncbi:MAG TPA: MarR family transcriptional regulator [Gemmataceae bacterium]|nr:MarR family transcriptional regulator [Gemmataceae bacterium]
MVATGPGVRVEEIAHGFFEIITQLGLTVPHGRRRRTGELKDVEFLTLALLQDRGTMTVGDIQKVLGVLPAQMSRVIRSLEARENSMIACHINAQDKRRIDVRLTSAGEKALHDYEATRVSRIIDVLRDLSEEDKEELGRLLDKLRGALLQSRSAGSA